MLNEKLRIHKGRIYGTKQPQPKEISQSAIKFILMYANKGYLIGS
jgi:hypothetical protein